MATRRLVSHDAWDSPMIPQITGDMLQVLSDDALARAVTEADLAYRRALKYEPRNLDLISRLEGDLDALCAEQRMRSPYFRRAVAVTISYAQMLDSRRHVRR